MRVENVRLYFPFGLFSSREEAKAADDNAALDQYIPSADSSAGFLIFADVSTFPTDGLPVNKVTKVDIDYYYDGAKTVLSIGKDHYLLMEIEASIEADGVIHDSSDVNEALVDISDAMLRPDNDDDRSAKINQMITNLIENCTTEAREIIAAIAAYEQESEYSDEAKKVCEIMLAPKVQLQQELPLGEV
jgi:hypothetical protein